MQDFTFFVPFVIAAFVLALVVYIFGIRRRASRARVAQLFAAQHGFRSEGDINPFRGLTPDRTKTTGGAESGGIQAGAPSMLIDLAAGSGTIRNVLRGATAAGEAILFDYRPPSIDAGPRPEGAFSTFAAFRVAGIPELQVWPRGRFGFDIKGIDFPTSPRFSKRFTVSAKDEAAVRKQFSTAVLEACEALSEKRRWNFQGGSGWLLVTFGEEGERRELVEQSARVAAAMQ